METIKANEISNFISSKGDCILITSASFEDRCSALVNNLSSIEFSNSFICRNIDFDSRVIENSIKISKKLNSKPNHFVDLKISEPIFTFLNLISAFGNIFIDSPKAVIIDITTFTHEGLLMIFRILHDNKRKEDQIFLVYNGAKDYSSNEAERDNKWLTKGVKDVRSIIGYPGYSDPSQKNHLIILFGFERERTIRLIDEFDYEKISLAFGFQDASISHQHQIINEERHGEILSIYNNAKKFNISLNNPLKTKEEILSYISKYKDYNTVIAPMNNKLSTIGAGLAAIENKSIQLCYLQANRYNLDGYSIAGDIFYVWEMGKK